MEIKIWSDVRCPFCYIGKRKFEAALEKFPQKEEVTVVWKSFQLDPNLETRTDINTLQYFAETKGISAEQAQQMMNGAAQMGKEVDIDFQFEKSVLANSFNAHRLIQFAKNRGLGNEIEEALFKAHFEEGKNIDHTGDLSEIARSIGLNAEEVDEVLNSAEYAYDVKQDEMEARNIGVTGVPFFVFDDKFAVSGAQPEEIFLETLKKAWQHFSSKKNDLEIKEGPSCSTDGCE